MENKYKEYGSIIIATLLHGIFTYKCLGSMPHISLDTFKGASIKAFFLWMIYDMVLYLIIEKWILLREKMQKYCIYAIAFGGISVAIKGGIDFVIGRWGAMLQDVIKIASMVQAVTIFFGIILINVLYFVVAKRKIHFNIKRIRVPVCLIISIVVGYILFVSNYFQQYQEAIQNYNANEEEIWHLNYYIGGKILDANVWFYVAFYIVFWWFMRRLTEKPEQVEE